MAVRARAVLALVALLVLAPILAAVVISALLLFGVDPHLVFLPGFFVMSRLEAFGVHAPRSVGVLATGVFWWAIVVSLWLLLRRFLARRQRE